KYLRKKWKDPITGDDFLPVGGAAASQGGQQPGQQQGQQGQQGQAAGLTGVASKSAAASIIVYQQLQQHNLWNFTYQAACQNQNVRINCNPQQNNNGQPGRNNPGGQGPGRGAPGA